MNSEIIQHKWKEGYCPLINGVIFDNGRIVELQKPVIGLASLKIKGETSINDFINNDNHWVSINSLCNFLISDQDLLISGGEGGMGEDGFVALSRNSTEQLIWIAFFDYSNPFTEVSLNADHVLIASTTYGDIWQFPLDNPEQIQVFKM